MSNNGATLDDTFGTFLSRAVRRPERDINSYSSPHGTHLKVFAFKDREVSGKNIERKRGEAILF